MFAGQLRRLGHVYFRVFSKKADILSQNIRHNTLAGYSRYPDRLGAVPQVKDNTHATLTSHSVDQWVRNKGHTMGSSLDEAAIRTYHEIN